MIIFDDFDNNNIQAVERFDSSLVYNRLILSNSNSNGMYVFACNFGGLANAELDVHVGDAKIASGNITANTRSVVNYINTKTELIDLGITARVINNYIIGNVVIEDAIIIYVGGDYNEVLFSATPYYLLRTTFDKTTDITNNKVRFIPLAYDPNILYSSILSDGESELVNGAQLLAPDLQFIGTDINTYRSISSNYLGFYKDNNDILTLVVDYKMQNVLPLEEIEVRLNVNNIEKFSFLNSWDELGVYIYKKFFLIGSGKLDDGTYKVKLKEI